MIASTHRTNNPDETRRLAAALAARLRPGAVLALHGELGAGKTCFVQGLAEALGVTRPVTSPTYTLVSEYAARLRVSHLDLYRLRGSSEALGMGLDEYLYADGVTAIEWAERAGALLPGHTIHIRLAPGATPDERLITIEEPDPC
jgi:tRNA threonylcarbamoyladenosine biosynthesis protein TsaE